MKKDNVLKKEFQRKDVERLRNLVKGKHGDKTTLGIGYTKKQEHYHEGDVWEEDGRTWTIKNGLKQNVTKLDSFKQMANLPLFCPSCNKLMKKHLPGTKLILSPAKLKQKYAAPNHILIDDKPSNIEEWRSQGGIGILHTSATNTISQLKELGL